MKRLHLVILGATVFNLVLTACAAPADPLANLIGPDGRERIDGMRFLDWPSSPNKQGVSAGLQGLLVMTLESGARLMTTLGDKQTAGICTEAAARGRKVVPDVNKSKSGAALLSLAGMMDAKQTSDKWFHRIHRARAKRG